MTKLCTNCQKPIIRGPKANNVRYCAECRTEAYKYKEYRRQWQLNRSGQYKEGKKQCLICGKWYNKPVSHAYNYHGVDKRSYKEAFGLDVRRGIVAEVTKEKLQEAVKNNFELVVKQNLITKGKNTRFTRGDPTIGKYERSQQTKERLKKQGEYIAGLRIKRKGLKV